MRLTPDGDLEYAQDWVPGVTPSGGAPFQGAGDNAFEALIAGPELAQVATPPLLFCDSFPQAALVHLKIAAVRVLPVQSVRSFFGLGYFGRRVWFYHELREGLSAEVRAFWDKREPLIRAGLLSNGRYEQALTQFRTRVLPLAHSRATVDRLLACTTLAEHESFVESHWRSRRWSVLRRAHPLAAAIDAALAEGTPASGNFRLQWRLTGQYADLERGPAWLTTTGHAILRRRLDRLSITLRP